MATQVQDNRRPEAEIVSLVCSPDQRTCLFQYRLEAVLVSGGSHPLQASSLQCLSGAGGAHDMQTTELSRTVIQSFWM